MADNYNLPFYSFIKMANKIREDLIEMYPPISLSEKKKEKYYFRLNNGLYRFFDENYCGACGVASYMMTLLAKQQNINLELVGHNFHIWCKWNKFVVDITFGQFDNRKPIYIGKDNCYPYNFVEQHEIVSNLEVRYLLRRYPRVQNPFSNYHNKKIQNWISSI